MNSSRQVLHGILSNQALAILVLGSLVTILVLFAPIAYMVVEYEISVDFLTKPLTGTVIALTCGYGLVRAGINHPLFEDRYRRWLANTPWVPGKPLPKGPIHFTSIDVVVVAAASLVCFALSLTIAPPRWPFVLAPAIAFTLALTIVWTLANGVTQQASYVYAILIIPILFRITDVQIAWLSVCPFVTAIVAWLGVRQSLTSFPWDDRNIDASRLRTSSGPQVIVGWPYRELLYARKDPRCTWKKALSQGTLLAVWVWLIFCANKDAKSEDFRAMMMFLALVTMVAAFWRLSKYGSVICDMLCFGQRIMNRKWFIWRHDQIFLAPLLMIALGWTLPWLLVKVIGMSTGLACGLSVGIVFAIGRAMAPDLERLQFTGVHSMSGSLVRSKNQGFTTTSVVDN